MMLMLKCGTDTGSRMYKIEAGSVFGNLNNYPKDSKYYNNSNNVAVDKMKYETCGVPIKDFLG